MTPYGKVAQAAIAATSLLAEHYVAPSASEKKSAGDESSTQQRLNSRQIAEQRKLSQAIVAKVLTTLSQCGVVAGSPGPGGGYTLAKPPQEISLHEVVAPFERLESTLVCPFGEGWCGNGPQCPLHDELSAMRERIEGFLKNTTLASFQRDAKANSGQLLTLL